MFALSDEISDSVSDTVKMGVFYLHESIEVCSITLFNVSLQNMILKIIVQRRKVFNHDAFFPIDCAHAYKNIIQLVLLTQETTLGLW